MKILVTTLNAKYIHSSLSIRYLRAFTQDIAPDMEMREYNINQRADGIAADLYLAKPNVVAFACYIWNIEETIKVISILKKVHPSVVIMLGGPEVSYDPEDLLAAHAQIDYIITGEGEATFRELLLALQGEVPLNTVQGLAYREQGAIVLNADRGLLDELDVIPWPYADLAELQDKIIYYECSRGCPFQCQYCLSSTLSGVRFFSLERVKSDLLCFIKAGVKQVKFIDRTFNCRREYAWEIFRFLAEQPGETNFHFEIAADLLDEELIAFLAAVRPGKFQFEIGVQSTYPPTLGLIARQMNWDRVRRNVSRLVQGGNLGLHLDLIFGLPGESYQQFKRSFDDVYYLNPGRMQLGFLKMLKGSGLRRRAADFNYVFMEQPPYEVLSNCDINYEQLLKMKRIEDLLEKYKNSHHFVAALNYALCNHAESPFAFFEDLAAYWFRHNHHKVAHCTKELHRILYEYYCTCSWPGRSVFQELLKFDYLRSERLLKLPDFLVKFETTDYQRRFYAFLGKPENVKRFLPCYENLSAREISRRVLIETFRYDVTKLLEDPREPVREQPVTLLFKYEERDPIYHRAGFVKIEI